jgi:hypothetical protein
MTRDEAQEAGLLSEALDEVDSIGSLADEPETEIGIGLGINHSDAGSECIGSDAIVTKEIAMRVWAFLRKEIVFRLAELGVEE